MKVVILHYQEGEKKDVALSFVDPSVPTLRAVRQQPGLRGTVGLYDLVPWANGGLWGSMDFIWECLTPSLGKPCLSGLEDRHFPQVLLYILTFFTLTFTFTLTAYTFKKGDKEGELIEKGWQGWEMFASKIFVTYWELLMLSLKITSSQFSWLNSKWQKSGPCLLKMFFKSSHKNGHNRLIF